MQKERDKRISKRTTQGLPPMKFTDRDILEQKLNGLTTINSSASDAMIVVMDLNYYAADVVSTILVACSFERHNPIIALAYLISDVLYNSSQTTSDFWSFRLHFEWVLPEYLEVLNFCWREFEKNKCHSSKLNQSISQDEVTEAQVFKDKIIRLIQLWNNWAVYDSNFLAGLEILFLCQSLEESLLKTCEIEDHVIFRLSLYLQRVSSLPREKLEREAHNQGVSARGTVEQIVKRLRVVELAKLEKQARNFPALWSPKKLAIQEANAQMILFMKKFGYFQEDNYHSSIEDEIEELSKQALDEWMSIGISLFQFLKNNNNQFLDENSINEQDNLGIPLTPFDEIVYEIKQTSKVYVQPGFEVIEEEPIKPDGVESQIPSESELNGIMLSSEEIGIILTLKHQSTIVSKYDISYLSKQVPSQIKKEEIAKFNQQKNEDQQKPYLSSQKSSTQRAVSPQRMGQKYQKLNLPSITSFKKELESQTKNTTLGYSGIRGSSRRNASKSSSYSSRSTSSKSSSSSSSNSSSTSRSKSSYQNKNSSSSSIKGNNQYPKIDRYSDNRINANQRQERYERKERNNQNDRKNRRSRSRSNSRRYDSNKNQFRSDKRQRPSISYSPSTNDQSGTIKFSF